MVLTSRLQQFRLPECLGQGVDHRLKGCGLIIVGRRAGRCMRCFLPGRECKASRSWARDPASCAMEGGPREVPRAIGNSLLRRTALLSHPWLAILPAECRSGAATSIGAEAMFAAFLQYGAFKLVGHVQSITCMSVVIMRVGQHGVMVPQTPSGRQRILALSCQYRRRDHARGVSCLHAAEKSCLKHCRVTGAPAVRTIAVGIPKYAQLG